MSIIRKSGQSVKNSFIAIKGSNEIYHQLQGREEFGDIEWQRKKAIQIVEDTSCTEKEAMRQALSQMDVVDKLISTDGNKRLRTESKVDTSEEFDFTTYIGIEEF